MYVLLDCLLLKQRVRLLDGRVYDGLLFFSMMSCFCFLFSRFCLSFLPSRIFKCGFLMVAYVIDTFGYNIYKESSSLRSHWGFGRGFDKGYVHLAYNAALRKKIVNFF